MGSTVLALFYPQARITGLEMKTANLDLLVSVKGGDSPIFEETGRLYGAVTLQPNMNPYVERFWLMNNSSIAQQLDLTVQLEGETNGDWEEIKDLVSIEFIDPQVNESSGWFTLAEWLNQARPLPTPHLTETQRRKYEIHYEFADTYPADPDGDGPIKAGDPIGNEMMGKEAVGFNLFFEGVPTTL